MPDLITSLSDIENVVNEYARSISRNYNINPEHFRVQLVSELVRGDMQVIPGGVVQIIMLWPDVQPIMNMKLQSAFRLMTRYPLRRTLEIVPVAYIHREGIERRKWYRQHFGEIGEIMPDLLPRHRLRVTTTTITTIHDTITGELVSSSEVAKPTRFDGNDVKAWLELSRIVKERHPSHEDVGETDTPELDSLNVEEK